MVGAHALGVHGVPRATGDLDIWIQGNQTIVAERSDVDGGGCYSMR